MLRILFCLALVGLGAEAALAECQEIRFAKGMSAGEVTGNAPAEQVLCYSIGTAVGQKVRIRILKGNNTVFGVEGLVDAQDDFSFVTGSTRLNIFVSQLMRAASPQPFVMRVSIQ